MTELCFILYVRWVPHSSHPDPGPWSLKAPVSLPAPLHFWRVTQSSHLSLFRLPEKVVWGLRASAGLDLSLRITWADG